MILAEMQVVVCQAIAIYPPRNPGRVNCNILDTNRLRFGNTLQAEGGL